MATIQELMPYLEQGYIAKDPYRIGPAYLHPKKQEDGSLLFEWTGYEMEGEWKGPDIHDKEYLLTWKSDNWGILCHTKPNAGGFMYEGIANNPAEIEQAIADGLAYKADGFRDEPTLRECPYCHNLHEPHLIELCPRKPKY